MTQLPQPTLPVDANDISLFPDLEYHDRLDRVNRLLRWSVAALALVVTVEAGVIWLLARSSNERIVEVVRINDIGKADAVAYADSQYKPQAPEIRYFLTEWAQNRYSRQRATISTDYPRNYFFMSSTLAASLMASERQQIARFISGETEQNSIYVDNVHITNLESEPYTADLFLTKQFSSSPGQVSRREKWIIRVRFTIDPKSVKNELVPYNPLGLTIEHFREDQAFQ